ncbi:MAG: hypothetical protein LEGION0403_FIIPPAGN_02411 [Legionella sp.]|uniref:hypothetical protein n=1 Tax=Legionella sp. TaxID=459 RepID=UPI003D1013D0
MNHEITNSLFSNFQSTIFRTVKTFLKRNPGSEIDKSITTTLRIPGELKEFYECLAEAEMTSINTAIVSTLNKVKEQTINEYQRSYTKINDKYDYQMNSFLKIIDAQKIDYNDLCPLLEWLTGSKIDRTDITNKEKLINIIDKKAQLEACRVFGYNYEWLQDNQHFISYSWPNFQARWYKNVVPFVSDLLPNFYLDETVESFELSFLCCDRSVVHNIISGIVPQKEEPITPFVIANRCINGIKTRTYHQFESCNINYDKCRLHFIVLIKMIFVLKRHHLINFPNGYVVTPQKHDMILDGSLHLAELFNTKHFSIDFYLDDIENIEIPVRETAENNYTNKPNIYHGLNNSVIHRILTWTDKDSHSIELTDVLATKCGMNKNSLAKYLKLFDLKKGDSPSTGVFLSSTKEEPITINLVRIREIEAEWNQCKILDTAFG